VHVMGIVGLGVVGLAWLLYDLKNWSHFIQRCFYLGKLCLLTLVCFIGIHLINSIPAQVQANPPAILPIP
jgi:uncharacterized membrane protein